MWHCSTMSFTVSFFTWRSISSTCTASAMVRFISMGMAIPTPLLLYLQDLTIEKAPDFLQRDKRSERNPMVIKLLDGPLKGRTHELLHVRYSAETASEEAT